MLSLLRCVSGLVFLQHGTQKLLQFPVSPDGGGGYPELFSMMWVAGVIEFAGGVLLTLDLFTRPAAFVCSGMMAVAYFMVHAPRDIYPILNGGDLAIIFCFVFFYLAASRWRSLQPRRANTQDGLIGFGGRARQALRAWPLFPDTDGAMARIDPEELLLAYRLGVFPMAEKHDAPDVLWVRPNERCILPLNDFHVPKRLARTIRNAPFDMRRDTAFSEVIRLCGATRPERDETWINPDIVEVFEILHARGHAHSIEAWEGSELVGGLYGLSIGAAFFGESMFSLRSDASKVALVHLAARLKYGGYTLLDAQFPNPHLDQFGALDIDERDFERLLDDALGRHGDFYSFDGVTGAAGSAGALGSNSGTSAASKGATSPSGTASVSSSGNGSDTTSGTGGAGGGASVLQVITQTS
ncbi:MAG: hypothetical protein RJB62_980 [Pseudomonadota bacterium]